MSEDLYLEQLKLGPMENFIYILGSKSTREVALIDPAWEIDLLFKHLEEKDLKLSSILVTHYHPDHIGGGMMGQSIPGIAEIMTKQPVKIYVNKHEAEGVKKVTGVSDSDLQLVDSGDHLQIGENDIEFLHTPGHTPGSQCFSVNKNLVSGDTLFINGCGRVDLPGSDSDQMYHSLQHLCSLPDDTILYPGHHYSEEKSASMAETKSQNAYLSISDIARWRQIMG
jgi:glyoxylase-like metal-dependent hydrolase (beta-lactamase superfamily II)